MMTLRKSRFSVQITMLVGLLISGLFVSEVAGFDQARVKKIGLE